MTKQSAATKTDFDGLKTDLRKGIDDVLYAVNNIMDVMTSEFGKIRTEQQEMREDIRKIMNHLDSFEKRMEISDDERLVMGHQLDRLNRWTTELADKIGHKLTT